jgi:hypothetical protein
LARTDGGSGGQTVDACGDLCGRCHVCNTDTKVCQIDPDSTWTITAVSASIAPKQPNGADWDAPGEDGTGPEPDPFCQFEGVQDKLDSAFDGASKIVTDSTMPIWNDVVTPAGHPVAASKLMSTSLSWKLWVGDDDGCGPTSCVAQEICEIHTLSANALERGEALFEDVGSCESLVLKLDCVTPP